MRSSGTGFEWLVTSANLESLMAAKRLLLWTLAGGALIRIIHLVALSKSPFREGLQLDAEYYDGWAQAIAGGKWIGDAAFWVDPLYAYVLGFVYKLFGHGLLLPRALNAAMGVGAAWIVSRTARRVWDSRLAEVLAAVFVVLLIPAVHFEGQVEKTALTVLLVASAVELFSLTTNKTILLAGVASGLCALARGNLLFLLPVGALAIAKGWDASIGAEAPKEKRLRRMGRFLAGGIPIVALASLHNWAASGEFVPTTTNLGINLYIGNHAENEHGYYSAPPFLHPRTTNEVPDFRQEAERRTGSTLSDAALSRYWRDEAWKAVTASPGLALSRTLHKLELVVHDDEVPDSEAVEVVREWSPVLASPVFWWGELLPLAVLGAVVGWKRRAVRILVALCGLYVASLLPFFVMARLRVQLLPMTAVLASGGVVWLVSAFEQKRMDLLGRGAMVLALPVFVCFYRPSWMSDRRTSSLAITWNNLGGVFLSQKRSDEAISAYEKAVSIRDTAVPSALLSLGNLYKERGDYTRAEATLSRLVELRPDRPVARDALRDLYDRMLRDPRYETDAGIRSRREALGRPAAKATSRADASDAAKTAVGRAQTLARAGRVDEAITVMQEAVRNGPYDEGLHYMLGGTMERHSTPDAMIEFFSTEVARDKKPQTSHYFWAIGLARRGEVDAAIDRLKRGLEVDPAHEMSQRQWGLLLEKQSKPEAALEHLVEATKIHPEFKVALEDAARLAKKLGKAAEAADLERRAASADPNTPRRYVYWARYLHAHGRDAAALEELDHFLAERPADPEALALRRELGAAGAPPSPPPAGSASPSEWTLSQAGRKAVVERLSAEQQGMPVWIVHDARDANAPALAADIGAAFTAAHWSVRSNAPSKIAVKAGIHFIVADEPTAACLAASDALNRAGFATGLITGYREFVAERRKTDPSYAGIDLAPGQDFAIVIGRKP